MKLSLSLRKFDDETPHIFMHNVRNIRGKHVAFLAYFGLENMFGQFSVMCALPKEFIASFTVVLPYFPTGSCERIEKIGQVATADTLARMLSNIPKSRGGPTSLVIYDIHALQVCLCFSI